MDYKYRSLLLNVPTRHLLNKMKEGEGNIEQHLRLMDRIDLNNIFLVRSILSVISIIDIPLLMVTIILAVIKKILFMF